MKVLALTCGDPGGIGPEIIVKSLTEIVEMGVVPLIIGPIWPFRCLGMSSDVVQLRQIGGVTTKFEVGKMYHLCLGDDDYVPVLGRDDAQNGLHAAMAIEEAVRLVGAKMVHAIVTAPISKYSLKLAGLPYTGHTTYFQKLSGVTRVTMGFYTPRLKTVLATVHVPLLSVSSMLTIERLTDTLDHAVLFCSQLGIKLPKIALAGFNPHAGEEGMFGTEERRILIPFVAKMRESGVDILGPYPADTLYYRASQGEFDMVISLYHDQGLIPVKLIGFHEAVNVTIGLPFVRTSPDHGTAYDIAYQDKANPASFTAAARLAAEMVRRIVLLCFCLIGKFFKETGKGRLFCLQDI